MKCAAVEAGAKPQEHAITHPMERRGAGEMLFRGRFVFRTFLLIRSAEVKMASVRSAVRLVIAIELELPSEVRRQAIKDMG